jgi:hypothetical protein
MHDGYNGDLKNQEIHRLQDIIAEKDEVITALRMGWDEAIRERDELEARLYRCRMGWEEV